MPQRAMQADDPGALADKAGRMDDSSALRQIAGAVSALAGRVDRLDGRVSTGLQPKVTLADRTAALAQARDFITELGVSPCLDRVHAELAVARYLTGE